MRRSGRLVQPCRVALPALGNVRERRARRADHGESAVESRSESGFSLIEVLLAVLLVGTVILSLAAGMLTLVRTSAATSQRQQIQLALGSATENLLVAPYTECQNAPLGATAIASYYDGLYHGWAGSWTPSLTGMSPATITQVEFWNTDPDGNAATADGAFQDTCPTFAAAPTTTRDQAVQRVTIQIQYKGRTVSAQVVTSARLA